MKEKQRENKKLPVNEEGGTYISEHLHILLQNVKSGTPNTDLPYPIDPFIPPKAAYSNMHTDR